MSNRPLTAAHLRQCSPEQNLNGLNPAGRARSLEMTGLMPPAIFLAIPQAQTCQAAKRRPIRPPPMHGSAARVLSLSGYSLSRRARCFPQSHIPISQPLGAPR
jgi:hypothetical protein